MHGFVFSFPLDRLLLTDRADAKLLEVVTFWAKAEKKAARLLSDISGSSSEKDLYGPRTH